AAPAAASATLSALGPLAGAALNVEAPSALRFLPGCRDDDLEHPVDESCRRVLDDCARRERDDALERAVGHLVDVHAVAFVLALDPPFAANGDGVLADVDLHGVGIHARQVEADDELVAALHG